jgi:2-aminobenzoate-CoA ligase
MNRATRARKSRRTIEGLSAVHSLNSVASAHVDSFVRDRLPKASALPQRRADLPWLNYPARLNCAVELLDRHVVAGQGDRPALLAPSAAGGEATVWSYRQLQAEVDRIAHVLHDQLGMLPGHRVLLRGFNHPRTVACWLAVAKAGGIIVAAMPLLRAAELRRMLDKAQIHLALCDARLCDELILAQRERQAQSGAALEVLCFNEDDAADKIVGDSLAARMAMAKTGPFVALDTAADDPLLIAFTSGTTGAPKAAVHSHRDLLAACDCFPPAILQPGPDDVFCGTPPLAFTYGLGGLLAFPLRFGAASLLLEQPTPASLLAAIEAMRATICFSVPTFWRQMAAQGAGHDLSSLRHCVSAGEPLAEATRKLWQAASGRPLIDGLGTTELLHIFASHAADEVRPGVLGQAVPGYRLRILGPDDQPLPAGQPGRLAVQGPTGCRYLDDARQGEQVVDGWNLTGDTCWLDEAGGLHFMARSDDMIVSSGYNIAGPEVEGVLLAHPAVAECGVVGVADDERGQIVKAYVVLRTGHRPTAALAARLQDFVKQAIAPYKYPRAIEFVDALPRTESSKLQRYQLRLLQETSPLPAGGRDDKEAAMEFLQPQGWPQPSGYAHGVVASGRMVFISGQVGWDAAHCFQSDDLVDQVRQALSNIVTVLAEAGGEPADLVRLTWYLADKAEYNRRSKEIGIVYRQLMGRHYPAMSALQVAGFIEDGARVEIEATAMLPADRCVATRE